MGGPVQLEYGRLRKRRRWLAPVLVVVALIPAWFISGHFQLRAKATQAWTMWRLVRAQDRCIASSPKVGDLLFTTDPDALPAELIPSFAYLGPTIPPDFESPYKPMVRRFDGLADYITRNNAIPSVPTKAGGPWNFSNSIPLERSSCIVDISTRAGKQGQPVIRAIVLRPRHQMTVELEIREYLPATLYNPATLISGWQQGFPYCDIVLSEIPANIRKGALRDKQNGIVALDVTQSNVTSHIELVRTGNTFETRCNDVVCPQNMMALVEPKTLDHLKLRLTGPGIEIGRIAFPKLFVGSDAKQAAVIGRKSDEVAIVDLRRRSSVLVKPVGANLKKMRKIAAQLLIAEFDRMVELSSESDGAPKLKLPLVVEPEWELMDRWSVNRDRTKWIQLTSTGSGGLEKRLSRMDIQGRTLWSTKASFIGGVGFGTKVVVVNRSDGLMWSLHVVSADNGEPVKRFAGRYGGGDLAVTPDDRLCVVGDGKIVDLSTGRFIPTRSGMQTSHVVLSPDGRWAVLSSPDMALIDLKDHQQPIVYEMPAHRSDTTIVTESAAFTSDGRQVICLCSDLHDSIVRLYTLDLPAPSKAVSAPTTP